MLQIRNDEIDFRTSAILDGLRAKLAQGDKALVGNRRVPVVAPKGGWGHGKSRGTTPCAAEN
jgi:hypothetical protein